MTADDLRRERARRVGEALRAASERVPLFRIKEFIMSAGVTRRSALDMQVCVPVEWTDEQVKAFADGANPCGTVAGWSIRKDGSPLLAGSPERVACRVRAGHVHVMLDA